MIATKEQIEAAKLRRIAERQTLELKLQNHLDSIPMSFRLRMQKVFLGTASPKQIIRATCEECCGYEDVKDRVKNCSAWQCPIHKTRPYQSE